MERPIKFGFIRHSGLLQDTAYLIAEEIKSLPNQTPEDRELRFRYFDLLTKMAIHTPRRKKKPDTAIKKKIKKIKKAAEAEPQSVSAWAEHLTNETRGD
jgi:hypothetical protein